MADDRQADLVQGKTINLTWTEGPTKGETHQHVFNTDGSVDYRKLTDDKAKGKMTHEKKYGAVKVADDVYVVSYLGSSGYTLTVVLNFRDHTTAGFASGAKEWFPVKGTFEVVG